MVLLYTQRSSYLEDSNKESSIQPIKNMESINTITNNNSNSFKSNSNNHYKYEMTNPNELLNSRYISNQLMYNNQISGSKNINSIDSNHLIPSIHQITAPNIHSSYYYNNNNNNHNNNNSYVINMPRNLALSQQQQQQQQQVPYATTHYYSDIPTTNFNNSKNYNNTTGSIINTNKPATSQIPTMTNLNATTPYTANSAVSFSTPSESSFYSTQPIENTPRCSLTYPLTPQTMISQQTCQSSPLLTKNDGYFNHYHNTYIIKEDSINGIVNDNGEDGDDDINHNDCYIGNKANETERSSLYYDRTTKNYVYKTNKQAKEGLANQTLVKHEEKNHNKRKKYESEDDEDSEFEDSNYEKNDTSFNNKSKRSRTGCLTCRQRKKRCCESKPKCSECLRLNLNCRWPEPGSEHKNKSKHNQHVISNDEMRHETYGIIKVLRGVVEYKIEP